MFTIAFTRYENIKKQLLTLSLELKPDEDSVYLIDLPHASDVSATWRCRRPSPQARPRLSPCKPRPGST